MKIYSDAAVSKKDLDTQVLLQREHEEQQDAKINQLQHWIWTLGVVNVMTLASFAILMLR